MIRRCPPTLKKDTAPERTWRFNRPKRTREQSINQLVRHTVSVVDKLINILAIGIVSLTGQPTCVGTHELINMNIDLFVGFDGFDVKIFR